MKGLADTKEISECVKGLMAIQSCVELTRTVCRTVLFSLSYLLECPLPSSLLHRASHQADKQQVIALVRLSWYSHVWSGYYAVVHMWSTCGSHDKLMSATCSC